MGDGELRAKLESIVIKMQLSSNVMFLGIRNDIDEIMSILDILVLPSFTEGLPNVVIQGQASGVPCIVSNNVTHEVDMDLNLVHYLGIKDTNIDLWCEKINKLKKTKCILRKQYKTNHR